MYPLNLLPTTAVTCAGSSAYPRVIRLTFCQRSRSATSGPLSPQERRASRSVTSPARGGLFPMMMIGSVSSDKCYCLFIKCREYDRNILLRGIYHVVTALHDANIPLISHQAEWARVLSSMGLHVVTFLPDANLLLRLNGPGLRSAPRSPSSGFPCRPLQLRTTSRESTA